MNVSNAESDKAVEDVFDALTERIQRDIASGAPVRASLLKEWHALAVTLRKTPAFREFEFLEALGKRGEPCTR